MEGNGGGVGGVEKGGRRERERVRGRILNNEMGCISGTSWNWNARLVPSESASKGE